MYNSTAAAVAVAAAAAARLFMKSLTLDRYEILGIIKIHSSKSSVKSAF